FIEQGHIQCGGNCVIRKQCYYSYISVGGDIRCKENSVIVGGELVAEGSITLGDAGATDSDPGFIAAGVVAERLYQSRKLQKRLADYQESIIQRLKGYTGAARTKKLHSIKGRIEEIKFQYLHINMLPGTALYSRPEEKTDSSSESPPSTTKEQTQNIDISKITIDVYGNIQAGNILQIGNRMMTIDETMSRKRFQLDESQTLILTLPLR
ncbi:MAG: FapA family protein, partial [Proteobacteria bacterium]|nr:FapA family protein [Pseudomonadota bacterium]